MKLIYFHRNRNSGYSIDKVSQTIIKGLENKREYYMPCYGAGVRSILTNLKFICDHREKDAIHHITGDIHYGILALIGYKSVLTIHDIVGLKFNKMCFLKSLLYKILWVKLPLMLANRVICISKETRKSLLDFTHRKDISVIYNAVDSSICFTEPMPIDGAPKILFVGTQENKNLQRCFQALYGIPCQITIIGRLTTAQINSLKENRLSYKNKCNISDEELNVEYAKCDIVSFCSLYEGFGMPVLEAHQAGRPVLCSTIPVLREIAGEAACYADPYDVNSIRNAYVKIIHNADYRQKLIKDGQLNAQNFKSSAIRKQWISIYQSLVNSPK